MHHISTAIASELATLRERKGSIALEDLSEILENVSHLLDSSAPTPDTFLRDEILKIANHIKETKNEITALSPSSSGKNTDTAELDAVMKATEEAAHNIMDAADEIQNILDAANVDKALKDKVVAVTARIYEACNFQDLTGQRIMKVMRALEFTESRIRRLVALFASDGSINTEEFKKAADSRTDSHLLNGPQLPGSAPSQADVDALFGKIE